MRNNFLDLKKRVDRSIAIGQVLFDNQTLSKYLLRHADEKIYLSPIKFNKNLLGLSYNLSPKVHLTSLSANYITHTSSQKLFYRLETSNSTENNYYANNIHEKITQF